VQCLDANQCPLETPVCAASGICEVCKQDDDCISNVCDVASGACLAESAVVYASPNGATTAACSQDDPCALSAAVAVVGAGRETIRLQPGSYVANLVVDKKVSIRGIGATLTATNGIPLTAINRAKLRVEGLQIVSSGSSAFKCNVGVDVPFAELEQVTADSDKITVNAIGCHLSIQRSRLISRSPQVSLAASDNAVVTLERTVVDGAGGGGIFSANGSAVAVANSLILNQSSGSNFGGFNGLLTISYTTLFNSTFGCGIGTDNAVCAGSAASGMCIDNSIIFDTSGTNAISSNRCAVNFSVVSPQAAALNGANNKLGANPLFANPAGGDFHLLTGSPAVDAADPSSVNVIDFDGTQRPKGNGNDMGAFERP
jgi:hypothetical protein